MDSADAIFLRDGGELGFGFERQIDDLIFGRGPTLQVFPVLVDRGQNLACMDRLAAVIATERLSDKHAKIPTLRQVQHCLDAARRSSVLAE